MGVLPVLISVPHAGLAVPPEVTELTILTDRDIIEDVDAGADEIYTPLQDQVAGFLKSTHARAFVDLNRSEDDFRKDGVIKTHTCWDVPVYRQQPETETITALISNYYLPYHLSLLQACKRDDIQLALDCHTMAVHGPPVGPDPGRERPFICLGNAGHTSCSREWTEALAVILEHTFGREVTVNKPFSGGYITQHYSHLKPWIQLEMSRTDAVSNGEKAAGVLRALSDWCGQFGEQFN